MFTLDELKGLWNICKAADEMRRIRETLGVPMGVDALSGFYSLSLRVNEEMQKAEKAKAEADKGAK